MEPELNRDPEAPISASFRWPWFNRLSLRSKILLVGIGRLMLLMAILGAGIHYLAQKGFNRVEDQFVQDNVDRMNQILIQSNKSMERYVHDYAVWDDSYQFILNPTQKYLDDNFSQDVLTNLRITHAFIVDKKLRLVAGRSVEPGAKEAKELDPEILASAAPMIETLFKSGKLSASGLIKVDDDLYLIAACQVLPTHASNSPSLGAFIHMKTLDKALIQEFSETLRIDLKLSANQNMDSIPFQGAVSTTPAFMILEKNARLLRVGIPLKDTHDHSIGSLEATLPRSIQQQAQRFILLVYLGLAGVLLGLTFLWPLSMRWLVIERVERIHQFMAMLGQKQTLTERLPAREGDELDALAIGINRTLDSLETSQRQRTESEQGVQRLKEQLIQVQKLEAIATMAGGVAHDFNNSLSSIMGSLELMGDEIPLDHPSQAHLARMKRAGSTACILARQMLNLSRTGPMQKEAIHLGDAISDVLRLVRAGLPKSIEIHFHNEAFDDLVLADTTQLQQVIMNFATNASHAMANQPAGCIEVSIRETRLPGAGSGPETVMLPPGDYLRLEFADNGHGIPKDLLAKVFDPFFTTKPMGSGTGLGLAVTQGFVVRHDGSLGVQSEPGHGATFIIHLPRLTHGALTGRTAGSKGSRLLLTDDDTHGRQTMAEGLRRLGHTVTEASNGDHALKLLEENPSAFDAVVTDQIMPGMTGMDLAEEIQRRLPGLRVFLISGYTGPLDPSSLRKKGILNLFVKPVALTELDRAIHEPRLGSS